MLKDGLADSVVEMLHGSGFSVVDCRGFRSSFDVMGKRQDMLILVKTLANVEGLSRDGIDRMKEVSMLLGAVPLVVSCRMKSSELSDGVVYDRYGVCVTNIATFGTIVNDAPPAVYSKRGNYCIHVNSSKLTQSRRRMGMTQVSLAKRLGVSKQSVYRYEASGTMRLEVFERLRGILGEDLVETEFRLERTRERKGTISSGKSTSFKTMVCREFRELGFNTILTSAPFDLVATGEKRVFGVVSDDWRRMGERLSTLTHISDMVGGYTLCVSRRKVKTNVSVLSPKELAGIKTAAELFKILKGE